MLWAAHRGMSIHREGGQDWWREDGLMSAKQSEKADTQRAHSRLEQDECMLPDAENTNSHTVSSKRI